MNKDNEAIDAKLKEFIFNAIESNNSIISSRFDSRFVALKANMYQYIEGLLEDHTTRIVSLERHVNNVEKQLETITNELVELKTQVNTLSIRETLHFNELSNTNSVLSQNIVQQSQKDDLRKRTPRLIKTKLNRMEKKN